MPYITANDRKRFLDLTYLMSEIPINSAGELNYLLTMLVHSFLGNKKSYQNYNDALGALEGCKLELYRRSISDYENLKIDENGDVP